MGFFLYRGYQQHDAHEFMHYLLDRVHTELLQTKIYSNAKDTIVSGIFGGLLQSEASIVGEEIMTYFVPGKI